MSWVIAFVAGRTLIGQKAGGVLSPVYELERNKWLTPRGIVASAGLQPLAGFLSIARFPLAEGDRTIPLTELNREDQQWVHEQIRLFEEQKVKATAAQAGLVLTDKMPERKP